MASHSISNSRALTAQDKELLAQLLSFFPGYPINEDTGWLDDQTHLISTFPASLLRPRALLPCVRSMATPFSSPWARLCSTHKALNPQLIHNMFLEITTECTTHLERFLEFFENDVEAPAALKELVRNQRPFVRRMQAVNGLWTTPKFYRTLFGPWHAASSDFRFERVDSGCEACILASVGGNHVVLSDLRASIRGRKKRGHSHAAVLDMVEAWVDWTGRGDEIREASSTLGKELSKCRREMQKLRRLKRRGLVDDADLKQDHDLEDEGENLLATSGSVKDGGAVREKDDGLDLECSIIDFYAKRMSNASPLNHVRTADGLHEAFRESIVRDPVNGMFHRAGPKAPSPNSITDDHTDSEYSTKSSEDHAISYQNLLPISQDEKEEWECNSSDLTSAPVKERSFNFF